MSKLTDKEKFALMSAQRTIVHIIDTKLKYMSDANIRKKHIVRERNKMARKCGLVRI